MFWNNLNECWTFNELCMFSLLKTRFEWILLFRDQCFPDNFLCVRVQVQVWRISSHLQRHVGSQLQHRRPVFGQTIEGGLSQQQRDSPMTQTGLQSHLDHLWGDNTSSTGNVLIIKCRNSLWRSGNVVPWPLQQSSHPHCIRPALGSSQWPRLPGPLPGTSSYRRRCSWPTRGHRHLTSTPDSARCAALPSWRLLSSSLCWGWMERSAGKRHADDEFTDSLFTTWNVFHRFSYLLWWWFLWTQWHHYESTTTQTVRQVGNKWSKHFQIWLSLNTFLKIVINECTLTMTSSTVTEPLSGLLGWVFVSKATEQGLNTYWTESDWWVREQQFDLQVKTCWCRHLQIRSVSAEGESF